MKRSASHLLGRWLPWLRPHAGAARSNAADRDAAGSRRRKWLKSSGGFYAVSATCHVVCVGLLIVFPIKELRAIKKLDEPRIEVEADEEPRSTHFELGDATAAEGRESAGQARTNLIPQFGDGPGPAHQDRSQPGRLADESRPGEVIAVPAEMLAEAAAAETAIAAALGWLDRHQAPDGHWSLTDFGQHCTADPACDQPGQQPSDSAATALALIAYFREAQTQKAAGPHAAAATKGLEWLLAHQRDDGDLSGEPAGQMYGHALATLAVCENYALTRESPVGVVAQRAIAFVVRAQHPRTGGWNYEPGGLGNTSVFAWQILALRTAQLSGLRVDSACLANSERWLQSVAAGERGGMFCYEPGRPATPTMTAVGLLSRQLAGVRLEGPAMQEGREYLLAHPPAVPFTQDVFYWYFGAPAMRNFGGAAWDEWFQQLRRTLIDTQIKTGCAAGSWQLEPAAPEAWSSRGGRLMLTSFAVQLLELEYGYSPLMVPGGHEPVRAAGRAAPAGRH